MDNKQHNNNNNNNNNEISIKVADKISAMLAYWDKDLICRFANSAYVEWFGKKKEEMIDKITLKELLGPLYEKNLPYINAALIGETQIFERDIPLPNGQIRHALANYYPDIINGEVLGFIVHVADVSPLKLLEIELLSSNDKISDQNKRLLNFSNIVSHNLKSYANNLEALITLYSNAKSEDEKDSIFNLLKKISSGFSSTVNHLNEITKSQNLSKTTPIKINVYNFIESAKQTLLVQIESTNTTIFNNVDPKLEIYANPIYIESIVLNLLTNAIKYRKENISPIIEFSSSIISEKLFLKITDNGKGINLEQHGKDLFGMYKTFHGNSDAEGIGLFITKYQIETMGGTIEVESEENVGTSFIIKLNL